MAKQRNRWNLKENEQMFARKVKFAALALATGMMQFQFFGCSEGFFRATGRGFSQSFGTSLGEALGVSLGSIGALIDLLGQLTGGILGGGA
jgi:hypothetical protein